MTSHSHFTVAMVGDLHKVNISFSSDCIRSAETVYCSVSGYRNESIRPSFIVLIPSWHARRLIFATMGTFIRVLRGETVDQKFLHMSRSRWDIKSELNSYYGNETERNFLLYWTSKISLSRRIMTQSTIETKMTLRSLISFCWVNWIQLTRASDTAGWIKLQFDYDLRRASFSEPSSRFLSRMKKVKFSYWRGCKCHGRVSQTLPIQVIHLGKTTDPDEFLSSQFGGDISSMTFIGRIFLQEVIFVKK